MGLSRFTFAVPADSERVIAVTADWVYVVAATSAFELGIDQEASGHVEAGTLWRPRAGFRQLRLRNTSSAINTIEIKTGDGFFEDRRGQGGGAEGIDPVSTGDIRAYARRGQRSHTIAANEFGNIQLYNPSGSGVIGAVRGIYLHSDVGGELHIFAHDTALANQFANNGNVNPAYIADADGALEWRYLTDSSLLTPSPVNNGYHVTARLPALGFRFLPLGSPILIPETWGLVCRHREKGPLDFDFGVDLLELPA